MISFKNPLGRQDVYEMSESQLNAEMADNAKKLERQVAIGRPLTKAHAALSYVTIAIIVAKLFV